MIKYMTGNLLKSSADALVNAVNCEGAMGKGIALQFKNAYPEMFKEYRKLCKKGKLHPGWLHTYTKSGKVIINFPTKDKWRNLSKLWYIERGLDELAALIPKLPIKSIAIPALGCGFGGLDWKIVRELIEKKLARVSDAVDIYLYEPLEK